VSNQDEGTKNGYNYVTEECHNFYEPNFKVTEIREDKIRGICSMYGEARDAYINP